MSRAGVGLALIVAIVAVALFAPLFFQAANDFRGDVAVGSSDLKAPRGMVAVGKLYTFHNWGDSL